MGLLPGVELVEGEKDGMVAFVVGQQRRLGIDDDLGDEIVQILALFDGCGGFHDFETSYNVLMITD